MATFARFDRDTGPGISSDRLNRIDKIFFSFFYFINKMKYFSNKITTPDDSYVLDWEILPHSLATTLTNN